MQTFNQPPDGSDWAIYQLTFPPDLPKAPVLAWLTAVTGSLGDESPTIVFETLATPGQIRHYLRVNRHYAHFVRWQLDGLLPDVHVEPVDQLPHTLWTVVQELGDSDPARLLRIPDVEATAATLLAPLVGVHSGEAILLQLVITPSIPRDVPKEQPQPWKTNNFLVDTAIRNFGPSKTAHAEAVSKSQQPNVDAVLRIGTLSMVARRADHLHHNIERALASVQGNGNRMVPLTSKQLPRDGSTPVDRLVNATGMTVWPSRLTLADLGAVITWPLGTRIFPGIKRATTRHMWADASMPTHGVALAMSTVPGSNRPITLPVADFMCHVHVLGKIGTGKSTVLLNIAAQLMNDAANPGLIVIDPHGDLAERVIDAVPENRVRDVVYLLPTDLANPVGFNLMDGDTPATVTSYLMGVLIKLFGAGPQTSELLRNAIYTVALRQGMTLYEVALVLHDPQFRAEVTSGIEDELLQRFWQNFNAKSAHQQANEIEPVMRRLGPLLTPEFRGIFGQVGKTTIKEVVDGGKIFIVNLSDGQLGEGPAKLLGSLLVARIWQEVRKRSAIPEHERRPLVMLGDEFQRFMHFPNSFGDILAEARKFKFGQVLAHQLMDQIREIRQDTMANTRNKIIMQCVAEDASLIGREIGVQATDVQRLGKHQAILSLVHDNHPANPATGLLLPPPQSTGFGNRVRFTSRALYGIPREDVEAQLAARRHHKTEHKRMRPTIGKEK